MMKSIVEEKLVSFKTLEQKVFAYVCELGRLITQTILENYDDELARDRDKKAYRDKGKRDTSIKTVYGEVEYSRRVYRTESEDGKAAHVYLLDQAMQMEKIGLISTNLAEKIALTVTEAPYRVSADVISDTCGQTISHGGVWNLMQRLGERISKEEEYAVQQMETGRAEGTKAIGILFEEMDGVWLRMQDPSHKKAPKQEMKVFTMYEGWDADNTQRSRLVNKKMLAGMEKSGLFHQKREALIEKVYDADEIQQRILNGDGGSWIKEAYDPEVIFQLDRFHIYKEIKGKIRDAEAQERIKELLEKKEVDKMLEYIRIYADSIESDDAAEKGSEKARELYQYLWNNREGLLPYQERGIELPEAGEGIVYKNMGVQENQNCTAITLRMKHRRMRWSVNGANNMAKALYRKENRELIDTIERYTDGVVFTMGMEEIVKTLSAAKAPKKDGKGDPYVDIITHHMPLLDAMRTASRKAFERAFC
ncbi:MAG TPA: ISLre2 family transposase [Candidatus Anaerobutyricum stercoripullorum]|uniref:ISLre2 family transposase n=1 Tax=Candidatus Anaerobutyricum stercoripullorum TaxID=2838456 RepID=A0A9D1X5D7_9FIRM|nr:ISLre2 family transposase [Candidatus Anaerobutyricum stercoripullorum]